MKTKIFLTVILTLSSPDSRDSASLRVLSRFSGLRFAMCALSQIPQKLL